MATPSTSPLQTWLAKFNELPKPVRFALIGLAVGVIALGTYAGSMSGKSDGWQYAFTNLTTEDSSEAAQQLQAAKIPFRLEAGGAALSVPAERVYEVRLLLASAGLPRGGGVGFELFDKGDLGVSEFTQKVNLRRATEGELSRTIGRISEVRSARVHLTLSERTLYRDDDKRASAAVVLNLQPGRQLADRQLAGIRHLVASAVPGLTTQNVTIVDGHGAILTDGSGMDDEGTHYQRQVERDLEQRVVSLLEPAVGASNVVARVSASMDLSEVSSKAELIDPDSATVKQERTVRADQSQVQAQQAGVTGAAANVPLVAQQQQNGTGPKSQASSNDESRTYELSRTTTTTVAKVPRLQKLSLALLVAQGQTPRTDAELQRIGELAKRAVGFDEQRGDAFELTTLPFQALSDAAEAAPAPVAPAYPSWLPYAVGGGVFALFVLVMLFRKKKPATSDTARALAMLKPGATIAEIEAAERGETPALADPKKPAALPDPAVVLRDRARDLASADPARAALLLKGWLNQESAKNG